VGACGVSGRKSANGEKEGMQGMQVCSRQAGRQQAVHGRAEPCEWCGCCGVKLHAAWCRCQRFCSDSASVANSSEGRMRGRARGAQIAHGARCCVKRGGARVVQSCARDVCAYGGIV